MDGQTTPERWWTMTRGPGPVLATAIHDGHELRPAVAEAMVLGDSDRLREEDPFTGQAVEAFRPMSWFIGRASNSTSTGPPRTPSTERLSKAGV